MRLRSQQLELRLPDAQGWRASSEGSWWRAVHARSQSELEVKTWRQGSLVDSRDCEAQARLWKPYLEQTYATQVVAHESRVLVARYPAEIWVLTRSQETAAQQRVVTSLLIFGAELRSCLALRFQTEATGSDAPRVLSETLALVREKLVPSLRRLEMSDRIRPQVR